MRVCSLAFTKHFRRNLDDSHLGRFWDTWSHAACERFLVHVSTCGLGSHATLYVNYGDQKAHLAYWICAMVTPCYHWYARQGPMPIRLQTVSSVVYSMYFSARLRHKQFLLSFDKQNSSGYMLRQRYWSPAPSSTTQRHNEHNSPSHFGMDTGINSSN